MRKFVGSLVIQAFELGYGGLKNLGKIAIVSFGVSRITLVIENSGLLVFTGIFEPHRSTQAAYALQLQISKTSHIGRKLQDAAHEMMAGAFQSYDKYEFNDTIEFLFCCWIFVMCFFIGFILC